VIIRKGHSIESVFHYHTNSSLALLDGYEGAYKKQYGMLLSYALVLLLLSIFNLLMTGFNIYLWVVHVLMALVAFALCTSLRNDENESFEPSKIEIENPYFKS
jgi:hypothetical protein